MGAAPSPHLFEPRRHVDYGGFGRGLVDLLRDVRSLERLLIKALYDLLREEPAARAVDVSFGRTRARDLKAQRHDTGELVARTGHGHIQQASLFFDLLGLAGGELRRK